MSSERWTEVALALLGLLTLLAGVARGPQLWRYLTRRGELEAARLRVAETRDQVELERDREARAEREGLLRRLDAVTTSLGQVSEELRELRREIGDAVRLLRQLGTTDDDGRETVRFTGVGDG